MDLNKSAQRIVSSGSHHTAPTRSNQKEYKPVPHVGCTSICKQHEMVMDVRSLSEKNLAQALVMLPLFKYALEDPC